MKAVGSIAVFLVLILVQNSCQNPVQDTEESSSTLEKQSNPLEDVKRHSEGTFTSDYSKYMDNRRAKDFVQWLMSTKRNGDKTKRHAEGTYTSDVDSLSDYFKAKRFVDSLKSYSKRQSGGISKRHIEPTRHTEASSSSDIRSYLEAQAAKDLINWLMKGRGRRDTFYTFRFPEGSNDILNEVIPEDMDRRHADGTFTSEINVVLDTIAAKEFLNWLLNSKTVQSRDSEIELFSEYK
ncbi:pro-glucagon-like isoform X1 [Scyliorhinus torazame]|uniref:pro-glucagon-like isoform X1 n=1 Tax=Scyliorhinus torazame TaxID=75743 RepID=UPI003B59E300